jgi:hypothetical protein
MQVDIQTHGTHHSHSPGSWKVGQQAISIWLIPSVVALCSGLPELEENGHHRTPQAPIGLSAAFIISEHVWAPKRLD